MDDDYKQDCDDFVDNVYRPWFEAQTSGDGAKTNGATALNDSGGNSPPPPPPRKPPMIDPNG